MTKVVLVVCILSFAILTQNAVVAAVDQAANIVADPQKITAARTYTNQTIQAISDLISNQADTAARSYSIIKPAKVDLYNLATNFFNTQNYFGDVCNRCKSLEYLAFRIGNTYLTANPTTLNFQTPSPPNSPSNSQLFVAEQQIDGTWAFKSLTQGKYIRAGYPGSSTGVIDYQTYVGPWERWYMQRHSDHSHIQSAQFAHYYWSNSGSLLQQCNGCANMLIVEHWPKINWLWNW